MKKGTEKKIDETSALHIILFFFAALIPFYFLLELGDRTKILVGKKKQRILVHE